MATTQLTKQNQQQVTDIQSLNMMRNTIRTAVSSVAYLRNLFDEEAFEDKNVSGLQLKVLRPFNKESKLILNWLEDGVFDALEKRYLKLLVFGIHGECDELIESYHFHFNYCDNGTNINLERRSKDEKKTKSQKINSNTYCTKEYARQQTVQLLRALILLTQSLSPLPEARYLSMKLWYYEDRVPKEYEPSHFRPARSSDILSFNEIPIDTTVGNVDTKHHSLTVKVKSAVDNYEENRADNFGYKTHVSNSGSDRVPKAEIKSTSRIHRNFKKRKHIEEDMTAGSSSEPSEVRISNISPSLNMSVRDDRTVKTSNTVDLLDKATEIARFLRYVNKGNLAMALDIKKERASNLIEMLLECGVLNNRMVRGKGYPVINHDNDNDKRQRPKLTGKRSK